MSQGSFPKHKLRRVGTIEAVDAISSTNAILQRHETTPWRFEAAIYYNQQQVQDHSDKNTDIASF